jgi:putative copper resistance protein D
VIAVALIAATAFSIRAPSSPWNYGLCAAGAALGQMAISLASHATVDDSPQFAVSVHALHLVLAGAWFGGLLAFLATIYGADGTPSERAWVTRALRRFSCMAMPVMIGAVATGLLMAYRQVAPAYAALVATPYGYLLTAKVILLVGVIACAWRVRATWLPEFLQGEDLASQRTHRMLRWVTGEFSLAVAVVLVAAALAGSVPAKHAAIDQWPYAFRFSIDATWDYVPGVRQQLLVSALLALLAGGLFAWERAPLRSRGLRLGGTAALFFGAIALALYAISTPANPFTYRSTTVPFDVISISRGSDVFHRHCTECHGAQGKGDGPLAATLPIRPINFLTESHTAQHTVGDFYQWITSGIRNTGMPAFDAILSEDERWDVINFLHALSRGYQSRSLSSHLIRNGPSRVLGAPNFEFTTYDGKSGTLNDFRGRKAVLLVLFSLPDSASRMRQLDQIHSDIQSRGAEVIAAPIGEVPSEAGWRAELHYPVVEQGAAEIVATYALFRRTISTPDLFGSGTQPNHIEFLIDRFGYLRARWIPRQDDPGWLESSVLLDQFERLAREKEILPPADDHVH